MKRQWMGNGGKMEGWWMASEMEMHGLCMGDAWDRRREGDPQWEGTITAVNGEGHFMYTMNMNDES